jgi:hypothetical protein
MRDVMTSVRGVVKNGKVELESPLPEGTQVECQTVDPAYGMPQEFWDESRAWQQAGANAIARFDEYLEEIERNETGRSVAELAQPHPNASRTA